MNGIYLDEEDTEIRCLNCHKPLTVQPKQYWKGEYFDRTVKCFKCLALMQYTPNGLKLIRVMTDDMKEIATVTPLIEKISHKKLKEVREYGPELAHYKIFDTSRQNMMRMIKAEVIPEINGRPLDVWIKETKKKIAIMQENGHKKRVNALAKYWRKKNENR